MKRVAKKKHSVKTAKSLPEIAGRFVVTVHCCASNAGPCNREHRFTPQYFILDQEEADNELKRLGWHYLSQSAGYGWMCGECWKKQQALEAEENFDP